MPKTSKEIEYHLKPAKGCPHCKGTGKFTTYWPDGSVCTDKAFCPHPEVLKKLGLKTPNKETIDTFEKTDKGEDLHTDLA